MNVPRLTTAALFALVVILPPSAASAYPAPDGYVVDAAGAITEPTEARLEQELRDYEERTTDEVAVAVVPSLEGEAIEGYATGVFNAWGIGQIDRNNGVLLVIAITERRLRIEVGDGLRDRLTDAAAQSIVDHEVTPRLRAGDIDGAASAGAIGIRRALDDDVRQPDAPATRPVVNDSDDPLRYRSFDRAPNGSPGFDDGSDPGALFGVAFGFIVILAVVGGFVRLMAGGDAFGDWSYDDDRGDEHRRHTSSFFSPPRRSSSWGSGDGGASSSSASSGSTDDSFGGGKSSGGGASGSW